MNEIKVIVISIGCDFGKRRQIAARVAAGRTNSRCCLVSIRGVMNHIERPLENHAEVLPLQCEESRGVLAHLLENMPGMPRDQAIAARFRRPSTFVLLTKPDESRVAYDLVATVKLRAESAKA